MSNYFDPAAKENKPIIDYFENKTWLIVDSSPSTRSSIKKSIANLGSKISNMYDVDNFKDALEILETKKPKFILGNKKITGGAITDLFGHHLKLVPNRIHCGFFVITEENSYSEVGIALEYDMDGIISIPFTGGAIISCILEGVGHKTDPSDYVKKICEGQEKYLRGDSEKAMQIFEEAISLHKRPYEAHYFIGQINHENKNLELAESAYEKSIMFNEKFFKPMSRLVDLYFEQKKFRKAYDVSVMMAENYPISPRRLPMLIRLSIMNKKYNDINNYQKIFAGLESPSLELQSCLSAGLVTLSRFFISSGETEKALESLESALKFSNGKFEILRNITDCYESLGRVDALLELFLKMDMSIWQGTVEGFYFRALDLTSSNDQDVLAQGEMMIRKGIKNIHIYKGVLERSIKIKRKLGLIEALILTATKDFPDHKDEFELYLKRAKESQDSQE